jgi:hypothetical protein
LNTLSLHDALPIYADMLMEEVEQFLRDQDK